MPAWYYIRGILLVVALLAINLPLGEAAAVTSVNTLYYVNSPPVLSQLSLASLEIHSADRFTLPILSNSYSVIGPGDNGETMYLVEPVRTAELVVGPTTTFTQPASTVTGPTYTLEEGASHLHQHSPATTIADNWAMSDTDLDCTFDTSQGQGECFVNAIVHNAVLESGGSLTVVPTTTQISWTGSVLPAATITSVSSAAILKGNVIVSFIIALVVGLVVACT